MFGTLLGAIIDRQDGDSGIEGAIWGTLAEKGVKVLLPIATTFAIGYAVQKGAAMAWDAAFGEDEAEPAND